MSTLRNFRTAARFIPLSFIKPSSVHSHTSLEDMDAFASRYSKSFGGRYSPWAENYEDMAKKTVIKRALKYAPISADFQKALSADETIKTELSVDMSEIQDQCLPGPEETKGEEEKDAV